MPKYTFACHRCTLKFERTLKMGGHPTHPCPSCKEMAPRVFDNFGFSFSKGGSALANSGVHDHDYPTADKIVGRSAEKRWSQYIARDQLKKKVREVGGTQALIRVDGNGYSEYGAMLPEVKRARENLVDYAVQVERQPEVDSTDTPDS